MGTGFAKRKKEAKLLQQQFGKFQDQLSQLEVSGVSEGGLVSVTLTGDGQMKSIKIKPECVDKEDIEGLELLIKSAYSDAQKKIKEHSPQGMPNMPNLQNLLG